MDHYKQKIMIKAEKQALEQQLHLDNQFVLLTKLESIRKPRNQLRIQDIIALEEQEENRADDIKDKGLIQVDISFLVNMAMTNLQGWS